MFIEKAENLKPGDRVFFSDPENEGVCSRWVNIEKVSVIRSDEKITDSNGELIATLVGEVFALTDKNGSYLECYPEELE